jgi:cell filamentation protein
MPFNFLATIPATGSFQALMALQAGMPILDFSLISEYEKQEYITAVQAGLDRNYQPMEALYSEIIEKSISASVE